MGDNSQNASPSIKVEPGTYKRLPSFRKPRDLKLTEFQKIASNPSDAKKKVYIPNLNVQRKKQNEEPSVKEKKVPEVKNNNEKPQQNDKVKKERGKKKQTNFIQNAGVFSEGLAPSMKTGRWTNSRFSESAPSMIERPKYRGPTKVDKEEEAEVIKELLRDDFIDDPSYTPDARQCPVKLPLRNLLIKSEIDQKLFKIEEDAVKVKTEIDTDGDVSVNEQPIVETKPRLINDMVPLTINQLLEQSSDTSFIFFQLPHCLPKEKIFLPTNTKQGGKQSAQNASTSSQPTNEPEEKTVLKNLPEGKIGKFQLMKSGQARLILGDAVFLVDPGTQPSFKQDVVALTEMDATSKSGNMVHIGNITSRMIVSPDWEQLLKDS